MLGRKGFTMKCSTQTFLSLLKKTVSYGLFIWIVSLPFATVAQETIPLSISMENDDSPYPVK